MKSVFAFSLICSVTLTFFVLGQETNITPTARAFEANNRNVNNPSELGSINEKIQESIKNMPPLTLYGRVEDQFGSPVEGAEVEVGWNEAHLASERVPETNKRIVSDQGGSWQITVQRAEDIMVHNIRKPGYEYKRSDNKLYYWQYPIKKGVPGSTQDKPVVLKVRKKGEEVFLISDKDMSLGFQTGESGRCMGHDFIQRCTITDLTKPILNGKFFCDMAIKAVLNTNDSIWTVTLSPGGTNGGIMASDTILSEAPQGGYQPTYVFTTKDIKFDEEKYLFLRSRDPAIYTFIKLRLIVGTKKFFRARAEARTNPYGDRNLEPATDVPYEFTKKMTDEVHAAFKQNKRPVKPDNLQQMIKEAKEKAAKDKADRERPPSAPPTP